MGVDRRRARCTSPVIAETPVNMPGLDSRRREIDWEDASCSRRDSEAGEDTESVSARRSSPASVDERNRMGIVVSVAGPAAMESTSQRFADSARLIKESREESSSFADSMKTFE